MELIKNIIPMFLAAIFILTAAMLLAMGVRKKGKRLLFSVAAFLTELVALSIWLPCLLEICNILKVREVVRIIVLTVATFVVLIASIVATVICVKKKV